MTRVKICGLTRMEDVECATEHGADALGFVFEPTSPRYFGGPADFVSFFENLERVVGPYHPPLVQVRRVIEVEYPYADLQQAETFGSQGLYRRIQVLRPRPGWNVEQLRDLASGDHVLAVLVDGYDAELAGGTGKQVAPDFLAAVQATLATLDRKPPLILAGGLTPDNVAEAIRTVRPYAVDVSSGVEVSPGVKDPIKIRDFIQAAKQA